MLNIDKIVSDLCAQSAPSGYETRAVEVAKSHLAPLVDEVTVHPLGSLIGIKRCGKVDAPSILLDAHLDEIGIMITGIDEGFLRFTTIGGVDPRMLPDRELVLMTEPSIIGVVACLPPHIQSSDAYDKSIPIKEMVIDVGLSEEEAKKRIPIGTTATYRGSSKPLGSDLLVGKAMDDRACFAAILRAMELLQGETLDVDVIVLGSVQEETSSLGAMTATYGCMPSYCIAVDVTHGATPDGQKELTFPLGKGPAIGIGPNCTKWMEKKLFDVAKKLEMDVQSEVMSGFTGTNAWPMQVTREGVPTAMISLPLRYMHSPVEVAHRKDMENTAKLMAEFVKTLGKECKE